MKKIHLLLDTFGRWLRSESEKIAAQPALADRFRLVSARYCSEKKKCELRDFAPFLHDSSCDDVKRFDRVSIDGAFEFAMRL